MNTKFTQQVTTLAFKHPQSVFVGRGMATVAVFGSALGQVAVHENVTHRELFKGTEQAQFRYFISLDGKLRDVDAKLGDWWSGNTKGEATKKARDLAEKLSTCVARLENARTWTMRGADILVQRHEKALALVIAPFNSTVLP